MGEGFPKNLNEKPQGNSYVGILLTQDPLGMMKQIPLE
jgi:hypothetical protein